jgi:dienelactone hydrolase
MRTRLSVLAVCLLPALLRAQSLEERTREDLDLVLHRKYDAFYAQFSPDMKKAIALKDYAAQADQILAALGKFSGTGPAARRRVPDGGTNVTIPVHGSDASFDFRVSWNREGLVQGTWFLNDDPPPYSQPRRFTSQDVTVGDDEWKLPATLLLPKGGGPAPALVLVHGSGPNDRDETVGGAKVFRDLAEGLASRGIAVLRYDKRTFAHPEQCANDANFTMTREIVEDALRAAALLRRQPGIDPRHVYVLGHSQGGYAMPRIMQGDPGLTGVILLAGGARSFEESVPEQTEYLLGLNGPLTELQQKQLDAVRRNPWLAVPAIPESYKADLKGYHPVEMAKSSRIPMLVLQGERDYQVTMKDFALWKSGLAGRPNVAFQTFPALNHLFVPGEGKSSPKEYAKPGHVASEVIDAIAAWISPRLLVN